MKIPGKTSENQRDGWRVQIDRMDRLSQRVWFSTRYGLYYETGTSGERRACLFFRITGSRTSPQLTHRQPTKL